MAMEITCDRLSVPDYATTDQAGWPALPVRGAMLGIPPDADITLTILEVNAEVLPKNYDLCPVPNPIVEMELTGEIRYGGTAWTRDIAAYAADAFWPAIPTELVETGFIRSQRVAQIRFHPFQYNAAAGTLRHLKHIRVRLDFNRDGIYAWDAATIGTVDEGSFEETLNNTLLNYDTARWWRTRPALLDRLDALPGQTEPSYKVLVDEDAIYEVNYADLQAAGIETDTLNTLDPRTFQLHSQGQEVAIYLGGEDDSSFDPGDTILFYGQGIDTKYTTTNVYWLSWGNGNGSRMPTMDGAPTGVATTPDHFLTTRHLEEDHNYRTLYPSGPDNDHWYWTSLNAFGTPASVSYTTTLNHLATDPLSATVRGLFRGFDAVPEHHTQVYLNGHLIDGASWPPKTEYAFDVDIPQSYLFEGTNMISVACGFSSTYDIVYVNQFEIDYHATYAADGNLLFFDGDQTGTREYQVTDFTTDTLSILDITEPLSPTRILNAVTQSGSGVYTLTFQHTITEEHRYLTLTPSERLAPLAIERDIVSDLRSNVNSADYIIITHSDFYTAVLPLSNYRTEQGLRTLVVDVQDVYDEFGYGLFDVEAIHDFLAYAYANWIPPAPAYVLLVGDGNYDYKDNFGWGEPNYIPPYLADVDYWMGETAADNRYVCVNGADILPDMHLGRLPVKTSTEASALVDKILSYEQNPPDTNWNSELLFVADDADGAGDFDALSDSIADHYVPSPYTTQKIYYKVTPGHSTPTDARAAIIGAINEGRLVVNYIGHGSYTYWANGTSDRLFGMQDISALTNINRLPFMIPMTCLEGYFVMPSPPGMDLSNLGETIVRTQGKGAIASWSPTGFGVATGHDFLNKGLFRALFFDGIARLGPATTQGKLYLYSNTSGYQDLFDTYILFGDPALALHALQTDLGITKKASPSVTLNAGDTVTYTLTYTNAGPATAHHVIITDTLLTELISPTVLSTGAIITPHIGSRFVWDVENLAAGEGGIITITAAISPTFLSDTFSNTVTIATTSVESNLDNNTATATITMAIHRYYSPIVLRAPESHPFSAVSDR
jgi:uncharacterized repeat protein (TIGR01451 family)